MSDKFQDGDYKVVAIHHTTSYRGDHSADVAEVHEVCAGWSVLRLVKMLTDGAARGSYRDPRQDFVELRLMKRDDCPDEQEIDKLRARQP